MDYEGYYDYYGYSDSADQSISNPTGKVQPIGQAAYYVDARH